MFKTISDTADCEVRSVIRFFNARNMKPAEIHRQLTEVSGEKIISDGMVRKWVWQFNDGRTNIHDKDRSGRPTVVSDELVEKVNEKICENKCFIIRILSDESPPISKSLLHDIVVNRLNYRKMCSRWVSKMPTDGHKKKRLDSALAFFTRYSHEGVELLNKIVIGDKTWVCHVTPESKQQ